MNDLELRQLLINQIDSLILGAPPGAPTSIPFEQWTTQELVSCVEEYWGKIAGIELSQEEQRKGFSDKGELAAKA